MAVTLKGNSGTYEGTSEDNKPLDVPVNTEFNELDTGKTYYFDGETWNEEPPCEGSGFTPTTEQLAAMNSGITAEDVAQIETNKNNISLKANTSDVNTATANLQAQINNIITPVTQDAEVQNARIDANGISYATLKGRIDANQNEFYSFQNSTFIKISSGNMFNKDNVQIKSGYMVQGSGDYVALSGSSVTHPIRVNANTTYCFMTTTGYYGQNALVVRRCDETGALLSGSYAATASSDNLSAYFTADVDTFVCVNIKSDKYSTFMFVEGSTYPSEYTPYVETHYELLNSAIPASIKPDYVHDIQNPLYGKKLAVNGDSIMYGAGSTGGFAKIIAERNGMTVSNIAHTGATIASGTMNGDTPRNWICQEVDDMPSDADYYLIDGGVNDVALSVPTGTLSTGYIATLDTTTFYGAMESVCKQMITLFNGKKYGFVIPHQMKGGLTLSSEKYTAIIECCQKWGVPYIDLCKNCVPFGLFEKDWSNALANLRNTYTADDGTGHGDGWHPNALGYTKYYCDSIEDWMRSL